MNFFFARLCVLFLIISCHIHAQQLTFQGKPIYDFIENTAVFEVNQEDGRAYYIPEKSLLLNGDWRFFYSDTPEGIPAELFGRGTARQGWELIPVPSNWEMLGYGDKLFRNVHAPFKANPPHVPREYNPTGAYRKMFTLPPEWKGHQVFLRFEKVASASFLWINGQEVGYNEGAQEPAEYNITPYLRAGRNFITLVVTKYSDGYYLEGQDYWRLSGIFDDVWLYATEPVRLFDWQILTDLDNTYTDAELKVKMDIRRYAEYPATDFRVKARLLDKEEQLVAELTGDTFTLRSDKEIVELSETIINPKKWTSETPDLYTLEMQLLTAEGELVDQATVPIGFKETEIRDGVFYLNGMPLKVNAQNSHMQHPELGHVMDENTIRKDFEILKQFNFNAVRTSHYPPVNRYLQLANEYGLYIIDEAGVEAHATEYVSDKPEFTEMYKERVRRMVLRDRNHPCVLFWSAGNESGEGFNISEVVKEGKSLDPSRYWMYGGNAFSHPAEDIIGPRYPTPLELETQVGITPDKNDIRPSFMDEYLSVAGNGGGGLDDYWRTIYAHPRLMGGAIWDFVSTGLTERIRILRDASPFNTPVHIMGNARLADTQQGKALDLNGHDQWVEVYRSRNVEIASEHLMLSFDIFPRSLISSCGSLITKGSYQLGLQQRGKDSLEFYLYTDKRYALKAALPADWEGNWHQVTATYNGAEMAILIDGEKKASGKASGKIKNFPFPLNIGRNAEIHGQETDVYICDAQFQNVRIFTDIVKPEEQTPEKAVLWLDFAEEADSGRFYSYGIGARTYGSIWPDRMVQPEMWQMKKTVQPIAFNLLDADNGFIEVWNRNHFLNASYYKTHWTLIGDGIIMAEGDLELDVAPLEKQIVKLSYTKPTIKPGAEYRLMLSTSLKKDERWANTGHEVAWEQFNLPWYELFRPVVDSRNRPLNVNQTKDDLRIYGNGFSYTFDRKNGWLYAISFGGKELLKAPIKLNLWRAPLANELDDWGTYNVATTHWKEGYGRHIATEFYTAGLDSLIHIPLSMEFTRTDGNVHITVRNLCLTANKAAGFENMYTYIINGNGELTIRHKVVPQGKMPAWLPRIGLTMTLDNSLDQVEWFGRGPEENYPDRRTGYKVDIYNSTVANMYEPYLIPQDYGLRTDNRWVRMTGVDGIGLQFKMNRLFNFNAHPYSTENLTKALYTYQLQEQDGITFNLDYATSGVGCTARTILNAYRVQPQVFEREIYIAPVR